MVKLMVVAFCFGLVGKMAATGLEPMVARIANAVTDTSRPAVAEVRRSDISAAVPAQTQRAVAEPQKVAHVERAAVTERVAPSPAPQQAADVPTGTDGRALSELAAPVAEAAVAPPSEPKVAPQPVATAGSGRPNDVDSPRASTRRHAAHKPKPRHVVAQRYRNDWHWNNNGGGYRQQQWGFAGQPQWHSF
jgi:hypothetical protein